MYCLCVADVISADIAKLLMICISLTDLPCVEKVVVIPYIEDAFTDLSSINNRLDSFGVVSFGVVHTEVFDGNHILVWISFEFLSFDVLLSAACL